ncbi:ABC transporter substrate-binding protein [Vibrio pectenicida]|uniref:Glycine/betaine ABC transporter substrate-binding protein n=1 Tax=Vibrio pectenicida TaxID=62763 RepID=A0A3R9FZR0_9VIBR|nr:ABC transporter substrate-binding protein [Vibrio pectenicida]RSD28916.1 glycine/betaine ABC transporter substrate-binding protein [Vibrio pectenicida]
MVKYMRQCTTILIFFFSSFAISETVKLLELDWSSQRVLTHVLADILESKNVKTEIIAIPSTPQWMYLSTGKADIQVEVWEGSMGLQFQSLLHKELIEEGGTHKAKTREEWWYPDYVESLCPGLPDWRALEKCHAIFSEPGEQFGTFYTGPWEKPDNARIRALHLNFKVVVLPDGDAINEKIHQYISLKKPLLIFNWTPNWVESTYPGSFVEFPPYHKACEDDPKWGMNDKYPWDCGNPKGGWLKIAISTGLKDRSQCAFSTVEKFQLTNSDVALAAALVDINNLDIPSAAKEWLARKSNYVQKIKQSIDCR